MTRTPEWMPDGVEGAERVVLLLLDGLGWNQLQDHRQQMPVLSTFTGSHITTVAPSTTATALTSLVTGLTPGEHGLIGYRIDMGDTVMNVLRWGDEHGDLRRRYPPQQVQPCPPFLGLSVPVLSKAELQGSGFTQAHLDGVKPMGWSAPSSIAVTIREALDNGESFVYAYYDGIDKIAHERGFGDYYSAELRFADSLVAEIISVLPSDTVLIVTADHGQVHVGDNTIVPEPSVTEHVDHQSGEGRFRWLHARRGREGALLDAARQYDDVAWVVTKAQVLDEQWFGPRVSTSVARRMGDVALVAHDAVSFEEPLDGGAFDLVCRHGSLTSDEMLVPLLAYRA
jgi:predicted AlkP superfamily pyrophosphatase or phosphodiesterase